MKLLWFHLMPWTRLPEDFAETHASVWVDIDPRLFDARVAHALYNEFMDEIEPAAELGFDGVSVNEHQQNAYGLMPSPNLVASSLARRTSDTALVVMGNSLTLYNPPLRVAEEMAMIDCISGGRLVAGFPVPPADLFARRRSELAPLLCEHPGRYEAFLARPDDEDAVEWEVVCARAQAAAARLLWPTGDLGLAKRLHRVKAPTLLVWGERDRVVPPAYAKRFARGVGGWVEVREIPGAGHMAELDAPEAVAAAVLDFLG